MQKICMELVLVKSLDLHRIGPLESMLSIKKIQFNKPILICMLILSYIIYIYILR